MTSILSDELQRKLQSLRGDGAVIFDTVKKHFVDKITGASRRGLTRVLAQLVPVPYDTLDDEAELAHVTKRPRKSRNDPQAKAEIARYTGTTMARCGGCDAAVKWLREESNIASIGARLADEQHADKAHGIAVDYQLSVYVRKGRRGLFETCAVVDPCVGTLLEHLDARGWSVVATQMPIYAHMMNIATAIDILATDCATRTKLFLIEVKATRGRVDIVERNNMQYERLRGRLQRTTLRGMPLSYYSRHQLQLFCMNQMVEAAHGFVFDEAAVMRVSPGVVRTYALNPYYKERAKKIVRAIGLKTGAVRTANGTKRKRK